MSAKACNILICKYPEYPPTNNTYTKTSRMLLLIGASMSEPHTSELNGNFCVCVCVCLSVSYVLVLVLTRKMVPIKGRASASFSSMLKL